MITIIQANGAALQTDIPLDVFQANIAAIAPSPWMAINDTVLGRIYLNIFTVAYYYEI